MTNSLIRAGILTLACSLLASTAQAADLRASPVLIDPEPGARTATLTVINEEQTPMKVQIRVEAWSQQNGQNVLVPTKDVVASPPFVALTPGQHYLVRVVRTAKAPPKGEEAYRVLVDEVPDPNSNTPGAVKLIVRQSIPAFFSDEPRRTAIVDWSVAGEGTGIQLVAKNRGTRRLRLSDVTLESNGKSVYHQDGLVGYVLPGTTMHWPIAADPALAADKSLQLKATSDTGAVEVSLVDAPRP
jgi:fimbrial chaperone protein